MFVDISSVVVDLDKHHKVTQPIVSILSNCYVPFPQLRPHIDQYFSIDIFSVHVSVSPYLFAPISIGSYSLRHSRISGLPSSLG